MNETLVDKLELLKPVQQEFIVYCVNRYHDNFEEHETFHRGLLPFLTIKDATNCLGMQADAEALPNQFTDAGIKNHRFIRNLISLIDGTKFLSDSELVNSSIELESAVMYLKTSVINRKFRRRFATSFTVKHWLILGNSSLLNGAMEFDIEFVLRSKDHWQVTTVKKHFDAVTTFLAENFR